MESIEDLELQLKQKDREISDLHLALYILNSCLLDILGNEEYLHIYENIAEKFQEEYARALK